MKVIKLNNRYYILTTVHSFDYPLGKEAVVTYEYGKVINITYDTSNFDRSKAREITSLLTFTSCTEQSYDQPSTHSLSVRT